MVLSALQLSAIITTSMIIFICIIISFSKLKCNVTFLNYMNGHYDCSRSHQLTHEVSNKLQNLHHNCNLCHHNQTVLILISFILAHVECEQFVKCHDTKQWQTKFEKPHIFHVEKYTFMKFDNRKYPLVQITYNPQSHSTILVCTSAKTLNLILTACFSNLKPIPGMSQEYKYNSGVLKIYHPQILSSIAEEWNKYYRFRTKNLYIVGHSFGGSSAVYLAFYLWQQALIDHHQTIKVVTVASTRFGNQKFKELYNHAIPNTLHIRATNDIIQWVPLKINGVTPFEEVGTSRYISISDETRKYDSLHGCAAHFIEMNRQK